MLFQRKQPPLLGIDISSSAVKLLELSRHDKRIRIDSYAAEPLPPEAVVEKNIADIDIVSDAIRRAVKNSNSKTKNAAVAVSGSAVITKIIHMPASLSEDEIESQIAVEADQYIPYPLDEVRMDFEVLGPSEERSGMVDVLLAASRSENVDSRVEALEKAGLVAKVVDVEAYAIENAYHVIADQLPGSIDNQVVAIADVGASMTTLSVLQDGQIIYTREQGFGGRQLTEEIQQRYGLSYEEAGLAKRQGGLADNYYSEVLEPFKQALVQQIGRALQFFFSSSSYSGVDQILLAGGTAAIPGIDGMIEQRLGTPTSIANPFASMMLAPKIQPLSQRLSNDASSMLISCGLALRGLN